MMTATVNNNDNNIPEKREAFRSKLQAYRNWLIKRFDEILVTAVVERFYVENFLTSEHKNAIKAGPYAQEKMRTFLDILEIVVLRYDNAEGVFLSFLKESGSLYWLKTFETKATPPPEKESVEEESETDERKESSQKESAKGPAETDATQSERKDSTQKGSAKGPAETGATRPERKESPLKGKAKGKGQVSVERVMEQDAVVGAKTDTTPPEKTGSTTEGAKGSAETGATQSERKESPHEEGAKGSAETVMEQQEKEPVLGATGGY